MPCDEWKQLAEKAKSNRISYATLGPMDYSPTALKRVKRQRMRDSAIFENEAAQHRKFCKICRSEPAQNFRDPDPWNIKLQISAAERRRERN